MILQQDPQPLKPLNVKAVVRSQPPRLARGTLSAPSSALSAPSVGRAWSHALVVLGTSHGLGKILPHSEGEREGGIFQTQRRLKRLVNEFQDVSSTYLTYLNREGRSNMILTLAKFGHSNSKKARNTSKTRKSHPSDTATARGALPPRRELQHAELVFYTVELRLHASHSLQTLLFTAENEELKTLCRWPPCKVHPLCPETTGVTDPSRC